MIDTSVLVHIETEEGSVPYHWTYGELYLICWFKQGHRKHLKLWGGGGTALRGHFFP